MTAPDRAMVVASWVEHLHEHQDEGLNFNQDTRELTTLVAAPLAIWIVGWAHPYVFDATMALVAALALYEFLDLGQQKGYDMPVPLCIAVMLFIIAAFILEPISVEMGVFVALLVIPGSYVFGRAAARRSAAVERHRRAGDALRRHARRLADPPAQRLSRTARSSSSSCCSWSGSATPARTTSARTSENTNSRRASARRKRVEGLVGGMRHRRSSPRSSSTSPSSTKFPLHARDHRRRDPLDRRRRSAIWPSRCGSAPRP